MPGKGKSIFRPYTSEELAAIEQGAEALGLSAEEALLGRDLKPEEMREVRDMARRIAAILLLQPALDRNYLAVKGNAWERDHEAQAVRLNPGLPTQVEALESGSLPWATQTPHLHRLDPV